MYSLIGVIFVLISWIVVFVALGFITGVSVKLFMCGWYAAHFLLSVL